MTGDNVSALILNDMDGDGKNEMVVGSDDYEIRVFKGEEVINECSESDKIAALCRYISSIEGGEQTQNAKGRPN